MKSIIQLSKKIALANVVFLAFTANLFAFENASVFEVTNYPLPEKLSTIAPLIELAAKYPEQVQLKIRFAKVKETDFKITDGIYTRLGYFIYLQETNPSLFRSLTECLDYDPSGRVCSSILKTDEADYNKVAAKYRNRIKSELVNVSKEKINERELPHVKLNGEVYKGALAYNQLIAAINSKRTENSKIPSLVVPPTTEIFYIGSKNSMKDRNFLHEMMVQKTAPNIEFKTVLSDTETGAKLLKEANQAEVPVYIAKPSANQNAYIASLKGKNKVKETSSGYLNIDFGAPKEKEFADGDLRPRELTLYVMSQCPYGAQAMSSVIEAQRSGKIAKNIKIQFKYIVTKEGEGWRTLHGQPELDENIRQLTIAKHYPKKHFDYILERNKNYESPNWEAAAAKVGIDITTVNANLKDGEEQLAIDAREVASREIAASPTVVWENRKILKSGDQAKASLGHNIFNR